MVYLGKTFNIEIYESNNVPGEVMATSSFQIFKTRPEEKY